MIPWTAAHQASPIPRQEYWSGLHFLLQGSSPTQGSNLHLLHWWADSLPAEPQGKPKNTGVGSLALSPEDLPNPGIKLGSPALQEDSLPTELWGKLVKNIDGDKNYPKNFYASKGKRNTKCEWSLSHIHTGLCIQSQVGETRSSVHGTTETM